MLHASFQYVLVSGLFMQAFADFDYVVCNRKGLNRLFHHEGVIADDCGVFYRGNYDEFAFNRLFNDVARFTLHRPILNQKVWLVRR